MSTSADSVGRRNTSVMGNPSTTNEDYLRGGGGENVFGREDGACSRLALSLFCSSPGAGDARRFSTTIELG